MSVDDIENLDDVTWSPDASTLTNRPEIGGDLDEQLSLAPDPVWDGMPRSEFRLYGEHIRDMADRMGLRDWWFLLSWQPTKYDDCLASIDVTYGRKHATIHLARDFAVRGDDAERHHSIIHELMHCHLDGIDSFLRMVAEDTMGKVGAHVLLTAIHERIELVTDALAEVLSVHLPGIVRPGPCDDPDCPVLHADPANPIHPPKDEESNDAA